MFESDSKHHGDPQQRRQGRKQFAALEFRQHGRRKPGVFAEFNQAHTLLAFPDSSGTGNVAYYFESLDFKATDRKLNGYYADFEVVAPEKVRPHQHAGVELLYLISGTIDLTVGSETVKLEAGDAVYFDSSVRHSYHRASKSPCTALIVTA